MAAEYGKFHTTRDSLIERAAADREELGRLLQRYLPPLRAHLVFRMRVTTHQADDYLSEFIATKILAGDLLQKYDSERGKFRTLLLRALTNFVLDIWRKDETQIQSERNWFNASGDDEAPDVFLVAWVRELVCGLLPQVHRVCLEKDQLPHWQVFAERFLKRADEQRSFQELAKDLGFATVTATRNAWITVLRTYQRLLEREIRAYAGKGGVAGELLDMAGELASIKPGDFSKALREYLSTQVSAGDDPANLRDPSELARLLKPEQAELDAQATGPIDEIVRDVLNTPVESAVGRQWTYAELLTDSTAPIELLEWCKRRFKLGERLLPQEVCLLLYYAFIAAGLVHHDSRITNMNDAAMAEAFRWSLAQPGLHDGLHDLFDLFRKAQRRV